FDAKLRKDGNHIYIDSTSFSVKIPDSKADVYLPHDGKAVIFGLRPEDIHDPKYEAPDIIGEQVDGSVEVTELMGNEIFVFLKSGEFDYVARVDPRTNFRMGDKVKVTFNMGNMHIFDKETEQAIR
ncbi:MAG TPA: glycerol-3-phosphate ABC transporter ATP-binding protein, partial [Chloroflexi bacterium]|nr:glycerol-3-phosphate ABC transporter ATP-binding protein [Chloroflexota bacterium]